MSRHNARYYFKPASLALLAVILCSCGTTLSKAPVDTSEDNKRLEGADLAASMLLEAEQSSDDATAASLRLQAAALYMDAEQLDSATTTLQGIAATSPPSIIWKRDLALARIYLARNQAQQALTILRPPAPGISAELRIKYLQTLVRAQDMVGDFTGALRTLATAGEAELQTELWRRLQAFPLKQLKQQSTVANDLYSGWIELAIIDKELTDSAENWSTAIVFWLQQYPAHPAQQTILPLLRQQNYERHRGAGQIAVLLPLSGELAQQAKTIEFGILSAWYDDNSGKQPVLRLYDTNDDDIYELYQTAVADGAELVIGPLMRENVDVIGALDTLAVPVLALNTSTAGITASKKYYEFGLTLEDEVNQIAEKAWFDGHQAALALASDSEYGQRIIRAFNKRWQELGGLLVAAEPLAEQQDAILSQLREILHVRISQLRIERLEQTLGINLSAPNRKRGDISFIFMAAPERVARQVRPHMRFLDLDHVKIYAMSDIYHGDTDNNAARDMDLIQFPTMPWLMDPEPVGSENMELLASEISSPELFAFGLDAYSVGTQLGKLAAQKNAVYEGATGTLQVAGHKIKRKMIWAIFYGGNATKLSLYEESLAPKL